MPTPESTAIALNLARQLQVFESAVTEVPSRACKGISLYHQVDAQHPDSGETFGERAAKIVGDGTALALLEEGSSPQTQVPILAACSAANVQVGDWLATWKVFVGAIGEVRFFEVDAAFCLRSKN